MAERADRWLGARWLILGAAAIALVVHSLAYNFVTDDAYISFVFSRNFAEHGELTFNLGQPVEGYTNFLWTLVLGVLMLLGVAPELSSRVLGTACGLATLYVVFRTTERVLGRPSPWAAVPALLLASSSGFACWTSGGLETQLYTLLVAAAFDALVAAYTDRRKLRRMGVYIALAAMTRPEGPMIAAVLGLVWAGVRGVEHLRAQPRPRFTVRDELLAAAYFVALWGPWFAWRWWYYGWPFPNTYYVKASGPWAGPDMPHQMVENGLYYVWVWVRQTHLLYALPLVAIGLGAVTRRTPRMLFAIAAGAFAAVYLVYTVSVGGDFMGLHRFIMPLFVIAALLVTLGLEWLATRIPGRGGVALAAAVVVGFAASQVLLTRTSLRWGNFANDRGIDTPAFLIVYTEDRAKIGAAMRDCFHDDDFSIVGGAGAQPYLGRMRGIDVFGLVSDKIAHQEPRIRPRAGHTKFGSEPLLATYDPTFVFSCYQIHDKPGSPPLPCAGYWLAHGFEEVTLRVPGLAEQGEYYTFLVKKSRAFQCPGLTR